MASAKNQSFNDALKKRPSDAPPSSINEKAEMTTKENRILKIVR